MAMPDDLTCGADGSTGITVLDRINQNVKNIGDMALLETILTDDLVTAINSLRKDDHFYGAKGSAYNVPDVVFQGTAVDLVLTSLPAGIYKIEYSFQADFNGARDKVLGYRLTGDLAGEEFGLTISTSQQTEKKNNSYFYYKEYPEPFNMTTGLEFRDVSGGQYLVIDFVDMLFTRIGDIAEAT